MVGDLVRRIRAARDDDHDWELLALERLKIRERREDREDGHDDELRPEREGLEVPREGGGTVAAVDNGHVAEGDRVHERECASQGDA